MTTENNNTITGGYMRGYLTALRKVSGHQYKLLLEKADLAHYAQKYPDPGVAVAASRQQMLNLNSATRELLGTELYYLFLRNIGREFGRTVATFPALKDLVASIGQVKTYADLAQVARFIAERASQSTGEIIIVRESLEPPQLLIIYENCLFCDGHRSTVRATSPAITAFWRQLLFNLLGQRYQMDEVECDGPEHAPRCVFALYR